MSLNTDAALVFYYRKTGKYAMNVLAGALDTNVDFLKIPLHFPKNHDDLISTIKSTVKTTHKLVVVWSFYSPDFNNIKRELHEVRNYFPVNAIIHIAGGVHATAEPEQTLRAGFDFVAIGEGEQIFVDLVKNLLEGNALYDVRGLAFLDQNIVHKNGKGAYVNLNDYPACAPRFKKFGPIEITRGCIYGCKFCQTPFVNKARFRHRGIPQILEAVSAMKARGMRDYRFISPTSLSYGSQDESVNLAEIEALLNSIRTLAGKHARIFFGTFPSEVRPEHVNKEVLILLRRFVNNDNIIIGGQSGSQNVLDICHRGHDIDSIVKAVEASLQMGFIPNVDFLFGLPGETKQDVMATRNLINKLSDLGAKIHSHTFMPLPGTPFKSQPPGSVDQVTSKQIVKLTTQGKAYGQWKKQHDVAKQLANLQNIQTKK